jgi:two-component system, chemotaxis family, protein-glutamate methylesterase/glutaminase
MPNRDIIAIGASAGGVEALIRLVKALPEDLPAAIFIVLHFPASEKSLLPKILSKYTALPIQQAVDQAMIQPGQIYVAPPNYHLLLKQGYMSLIKGPKENGHRPAIDPLFRTAARAYGNRVIGIVLTGMLDDGTAGLMEIKQQKGMAIVQDPEDALFSGMPTSAIKHVQVDHILPLAKITPALIDLLQEPIAPTDKQAILDETETSDKADQFEEMPPSDERNGEPSRFICPECGGSLWELQDQPFLRFRCRTGHAYSQQSLMAEQSDKLEAALWNALRLLDERIGLLSRMSEQASDRHHELSAQRYEDKLEDLRQSAELIRHALSHKVQIDVS